MQNDSWHPHPDRRFTPVDPPRKGKAIAYGHPSFARVCFHIVMAGLVPAIHFLPESRKKDVDARVKPGHDGVTNCKACSPRLRHAVICDRPARKGEGERAAPLVPEVAAGRADALSSDAGPASQPSDGCSGPAKHLAGHGAIPASQPSRSRSPSPPP